MSLRHKKKRLFLHHLFQVSWILLLFKFACSPFLVFPLLHEWSASALFLNYISVWIWACTGCMCPCVCVRVLEMGPEGRGLRFVRQADNKILNCWVVTFQQRWSFVCCISGISIRQQYTLNLPLYPPAKQCHVDLLFCSLYYVIYEAL